MYLMIQINQYMHPIVHIIAGDGMVAEIQICICSDQAQKGSRPEHRKIVCTKKALGDIKLHLDTSNCLVCVSGREIHDLP